MKRKKENVWRNGESFNAQRFREKKSEWGINVREKERDFGYIVGCQGALQLGGPFQGYPPRV